jgi:hypothetical protein
MMFMFCSQDFLNKLTAAKAAGHLFVAAAGGWLFCTSGSFLKAAWLAFVSRCSEQHCLNYNNGCMFRVPHKVCLPGSHSKTVRAMKHAYLCG